MKLNKRQLSVLNYLENKIRNGEKIPCLEDMSRELDTKYSTLSHCLLYLNKIGRIVYKGGRVISVNSENVKGVVTPQKAEQHKSNYTMNEFEEKYNAAVKELICDYVKNIDVAAFSDVNNINRIVANVTFMTNQLKEKLFR